MTVQRFTKRPVTIEAFLATTDSNYILQDWIIANGGSVAARMPHWIDPPAGRAKPLFYIETLEGIMAVRPGDYVIRGVQGEFYPCDPSIFHQTYIEAGPDLGCMAPKPKPKRKRVGPIAWLQIQIFKAHTIGFEPEDFPQ